MQDEITATLRIATKQQYCYIEVVIKGKPEEIIRKYLALTKLYASLQKQDDSVPF